MIGSLITSFVSMFYGAKTINETQNITINHNIVNLHTYNKDGCTKSNYYESTMLKQ